RLVSNSHRNQFFNNSVQGNTGSGFLFSNIQNTIARNNTVRDNGGTGISLTYCSASSFTKIRLINNSQDGLYIRSASTGSATNNNFTDFIVHDNAKTGSYAGVNLGGNSYNNRFINFSLINNSWGIFIQKIFTGLAFPSTPYGNLVANFTINNSATSLYVLDALNNTISGTYCPQNVVFNETADGMINYTQDINFTITTRFSDVIGFSNNMIHVNSSGAPYLNKSAILTFVNLNIAGDPQPIVDYNDSGVFNYCSPPTCVELLNNSLTTFIYNVTHFTNYSSSVIPYGNLTNASIIVPNGSITINNSASFNVTCRVYCTGSRPCVGTNVTLDPLNPLVNLTQPTAGVERVYADSQFIYAASLDANTYVWNKTSLGLFATLPSSAQLRTVWVDSQYIYTGGINNQIELWNRTDLVTPFANVANLTFSLAVFSIRSDANYIYVGLGSRWGGSGRINIYDRNTFASVTNLTDASDIIKSMDIDSNNLYAASHDSNVYVYNTSDFTQPPVTLGTCSFYNVKDVSQDANYIYGYSRDWNNACLLIWHKSNYSVKSNLSFLNTIFLAGHSGNASNFAYAGGLESNFWTNGSLFQINKSNFAVADAKNITNYYVKSLYCDASYLYAGLMDNTYSLGMVRLFNNSCGVIAPGRITIHSITTVPSPVLVPLSAYCSANITFNGTRDTVYFNLTHPNGSSTRLSATNVGTIYNSQNFTVSSMGTYTCTVHANDTNGSTASRSLSFSGGNKGAIPMNSGSPFFTISQNPRYSSNQSCLNSTLPGNYCDTTWTVTTNGTPGTTWEFFCTYDNANGDLNSTRINVTIGGAPPPPPPPPPPPRPSGGGGGGSAARNWQQLQEAEGAGCIESWFCEPWGECKFGEQSRACIDLNTCGTEKNKPHESLPCKEEKIEKPAAVIEKMDIEEITQEEFKPTTIVESPEFEWNISRNLLRGALALVVIAAIAYLFFLSRFLRKRAITPKGPRMKEEDFKPKKAPAKKAPKKPEPLPETTKGLLKELDKL
ncbi:right-handed parallel beta-helix repeat-containing protein, partial [Candidatus Woesearchaeota archaeon]|nr:right-handed parallel beta-helix repeat-containing protein [Candidatus Woesearchaeota archaeon]